MDYFLKTILMEVFVFIKYIPTGSNNLLKSYVFKIQREFN
jgi:hypothetical protein